ncbi:MAG: sulfite exporter TauE/SafE family protein [Candidatus Aquicultor sp.]
MDNTDGIPTGFTGRKRIPHMISMLLLTLFTLGIVGGFFSGLLGIGGGIIMVPLLLYVPSLLGLGGMDMKVVAGITMMQSLGGSLSALVVHRKNRFIHTHLVLLMGSSSVIGALIGSIWSKFLSADVMLALFAVLALLASALLFLPARKHDSEETLPDIRFNKTTAVALGAIVGVIGGIIGQGGAFLIIPLMLYVLRIPTRIALGSSVAISFLSALAGFIGKWGTEQVPFLLALVLTLGAVVGAQVGGRISKHLQTVTLRTVLAVLIGGTALRIGFSLFLHSGISRTALDIGSIFAVACLVYFTGRMRFQQAAVESPQVDDVRPVRLGKLSKLLNYLKKVG